MKYFIDTEFKEKPNTIDLISIGIVCEDGREYYVLNEGFNLKEVWKDEWLRKNVLLPIYIEHIHGDMRNHVPFSRNAIKGILKRFGKSMVQIASEVKEFCYYSYSEAQIENANIEFYGYYADYDWVVFCWIFGQMINLPKGFPMYCKDLKQMMDDKGFDKNWKRNNCPDPEGEHNALVDAKWNLRLFNQMVLEKP